MFSLRQCLIFAMFYLFSTVGFTQQQEGDVVKLSPKMRSADLDAEQIRALPCKALRGVTVKAELKAVLQGRKRECLRRYDAFTPNKDLH